jgi:hypothetical protein
MATYTIYQQPTQLTPAYNDSIFVVYSSNYSQTSFNYIAQIYVGSDVITLKCPANPTYGSGVFNIGRIIENYVNSDIDRSTVGFQQNTNSYKSYYVKFGEEYAGVSGVTQYLAITTTSVKYVWNGVIDFLPYKSYSQDSYTMEGAGVFLTKYIGQRNQLDGDYSWLYWIADGSSPASLSHMAIKSYDANGSLLKNVGVTNPYSSSGTIANHFVRFSTGKAQLNAITIGSLKYGTLPIVPSTATYYTVAFQDASSGTISTNIRYNIVDADCKYANYRLHFLNAYGGFDSFNFGKVSHQEVDIEKKQYKGLVGALTSLSSWSYSLKDRGDRQYYIKTKDTLKLKTDWLSDSEYQWLRELIESPEIYLDDATYGLVSVTCANNRYDYKTVLNDKLFQLEIEIKYSFDNYRQRY